jgi:hypothetical protein
MVGVAENHGDKREGKGDTGDGEEIICWVQSSVANT